MAKAPPTVQQYEPLRIPAGWSGQSKRFGQQVQDTFDDIYRRFGRLRLKDMGLEFRREYETIADESHKNTLIIEQRLSPEGIVSTVSGSIENAMNNAIAVSSNEIKRTADEITISFEKGLAPVSEKVDGVAQEQAKQNLWIRIDPETGVEIGREGDPAKFRADNKALEVPKVKTGQLTLSPTMETDEWLLTASKSGLSIKWVGGEV